MSEHHVHAHRDHKEASDLETGVTDRCLTASWVLGMEPQSSERAESAPSLCPISQPTLTSFFLMVVANGNVRCKEVQVIFVY